MTSSVEVKHLFVSPGHNYFGHHDQPAGTHPVVEVTSIECLAGRGIVGDRFLDFKTDYKGQITLFDAALHEALCATLRHAASPGVYRRNVVLAGANLAELIGVEFELGPLRLLGSEECRPCYWMDQAFAPGAEEFLKGRGGLRARILQGGILTTGPAGLRVFPAAA